MKAHEAESKRVPVSRCFRFESHVMEVTNYTKSITSEHVAAPAVRKESVNKLTNTLISSEQKGNNALPHHNCSGSQLFCTSSPTTPPPRTQIQSEAAITREKKQSSEHGCEITFDTCNSAWS